jgi:GDPmannose 4,6-dehydratase
MTTLRCGGILLSRKTALITGITGQDGAVLAQYLLEKNYAVHGIRPYLPVDDTARLGGDLENVSLHYADMLDQSSLIRVLERTKPDEIYNLAAMSHVHVSYIMPEMTGDINGLGTVRILEAMRATGISDTARFYQASSSEMFGLSPAPQNEKTELAPCSPYGASKLYAYWMVRMYRDGYGFHASNGILFNHESSLRGEEFVTRKITRMVGEIEAGERGFMELGNLDARRDWGHARDYMRGAWLMLQQDRADDYVLATGETHSVREFVELSFAEIGIRISWDGEGMDEVGFDARSGRMLIKIDPVLYRPIDINCLCGDARKAQEKLGWSPSYSFKELVQEMVAADRRPARMQKIYG